MEDDELYPDEVGQTTDTEPAPISLYQVVGTTLPDDLQRALWALGWEIALGDINPPEGRALLECADIINYYRILAEKTDDPKLKKVYLELLETWNVRLYTFVKYLRGKFGFEREMQVASIQEVRERRERVERRRKGGFLSQLFGGEK